jgi:hypothetical protein
VRRRAEVFAPPFDDLFEAALERNTALDDSHPALRERLRHLGVPRPLLTPAPVSAADELLGVNATSLTAEIDREWRAAAGPFWSARHTELAAARKRLEESPALDSASLGDEQLLERADSLVELGRDDDAFAIYHDVHVRNPADARAAFHVGRILLARGDLAGLTHLTTAMERDWRLVAPSCEVAYTALREKGREKEADDWAERYRQQSAVLQEAEREARVLETADDLAPTDLPEESQQLILARCREARWVGKVWIARKNLASVPTTVNFVAVRAKMLTPVGSKKFKNLVDSLSIDQPLMVFMIESGAMMSRLDRVPGARRFFD